MSILHRHRRSGSRWMLHLAGIVGGFVLGRESEKRMKLDSGKRTFMFKETGRDSESDQQIK